MVKRFLIRWFILSIALLIANQLVTGIVCTSLSGLLVASLLLTALNTFVKPILLLLSAPLLVISLGLFYFILNAILLFFTGTVLQPLGFAVNGFWAALGGSLIVSLVSTVLGFLGKDKVRVTTHRAHQSPVQSKGPNPPPGKGPVIDI